MKGGPPRRQTGVDAQSPINIPASQKKRHWRRRLRTICATGTNIPTSQKGIRRFAQDRLQRHRKPFRKGAAKVGLTFLTLLALLHGCAGGYSQPMQLIQAVGPEYPEQAKAAGVQGWVKVRYDIGDDGVVENLVLVTSDPPGVFDAAALAAVAQWRYRPATLDGAPVRVSGVVSTLRFALDGAERYDSY